MSDARPRTVVVDFDGVIAQYDHWRGVDVFGPPVPGARESLMGLKQQGWFINIWTTRKITPAFKQYLVRYGIPYDAINSTAMNPSDANREKPVADVYVDDRSWESVGQPFVWGPVMRKLQTMGRGTQEMTK